jgi:hypothetical protein
VPGARTAAGPRRALLRRAVLGRIRHLDQPPGYPFRGPGLLGRLAPFAAIAALAEASLALTSGPTPALAVVMSLVLLLAVAAAFALPWQLLPGWLSVLMPLAYTGSVLALILAAGSASGVGIVILVPLIWTAPGTVLALATHELRKRILASEDGLD